jgi:hypothetical protein
MIIKDATLRTMTLNAAECCSAEHSYAQCRYVERPYAERPYAERHSANSLLAWPALLHYFLQLRLLVQYTFVRLQAQSTQL